MKRSQPFSRPGVDFTSMHWMPPRALWKKGWWKSNRFLSWWNLLEMPPMQEEQSKVSPARGTLTFFDDTFLFSWRKRILLTGMQIDGDCKQKMRIHPGKPGCLVGLSLLPVRTTGGFGWEWVNEWKCGGWVRTHTRVLVWTGVLGIYFTILCLKDPAVVSGRVHAGHTHASTV